jgi:E3 ubiquitin-protein ligase RGLG
MFQPLLLSIVLVGIGDGPWDMVHKFDDNIPARSFDNFQVIILQITSDL